MSNDRARTIICACLALLGALGCGSTRTYLPRVEGALPGQCTDGVDNDEDGAFDCSDPDCESAPSCDPMATSDGGMPRPDPGSDGGAPDPRPDGGAPDPRLDASVEGYVFPERDWVCAESARPPCPTTEPAHTDEERTVIERDALDATRLYVLDVVSMPARTGGWVAGFNLDGLDSGEGSSDPFANCEEFAPDLASLLDPDHVGVDNGFAELIPTVESFLTPEDCPSGVTDGCFDELMQQQISDGTMLLLVEVGGVDDLAYDSSVTVQLHRGAVPGGGLPTLAGGRLAPGQAFDLTPLGAPVAGDIFDGRVRAVGLSLPLPAAFGSSTLPLTVTDAELRFDIGGEVITDGQLGGSFEVDQVVAAVEASMPGYGDLMRDVLESVADVSPSSSDPLICTRVGVGLTFSGTTALRR